MYDKKKKAIVDRNLTYEEALMWIAGSGDQNYEIVAKLNDLLPVMDDDYDDDDCVL